MIKDTFNMRTIKPLIFVALLLLFVAEAKTQQAILAGRVTDLTTQQPIPYAQVGLMSVEGEQLLSGQITSLDGTFSFRELQAGQYRLRISFIGYTTVITPDYGLENTNTQIDTIEVILSPLPVQLEMMQVTAETMTVSTGIDRRTYRAADFETARGGNAADVLNKLPSVSVSPDGEVSVRGTTEFMVYLNGRPVQMEPSMVLAQIQAGSIESIDIITVPTARYEAQGKGGIININTKSGGIRGWAVAVNGLAGGAPWNHKEEPLTGDMLNDNRYGGGVNVMFTEQKYSISGAIQYNFRNINATRSGEARILHPTDNSYKHLVASGTKPERYQNVSANLGADYQITTRQKLSASWYYGNRTEWRQANYIYQIFSADQEKQPIAGIPVNEEWIFNPNEGIRKGVFNVFNIDYQHKTTMGSAFTVSALFEHSMLSQQVDNPNIQYDPITGLPGDLTLRYWQEDRTPLNGLRLSAEYSGKLKSGQKFLVGLQPQLFFIDGSFLYDTLHIPSQTWGSFTDLENRVEMMRGIYAGFADFSGKLRKLDYKAGLRIEYTDQVLHIENPEYFTILDRETKVENIERHTYWFPSIHAGYPVFGNDRITVAASRRINRSPLKNMAPFLYRRHLEVYVVGDPELKPEYITIAELSYLRALGNHRITFTGFYRGVDQAVFRVNTVLEEEMVLIRSFTNSGNTKAMGGEVTVNLEFGKRIKIFAGGSLFDYHVKAEIFDYQEDQRSMAWSLKGNVMYQAAHSWRIAADFDVRSGRVTAQGRDELLGIVNASASWAPPKYSRWTMVIRGLNLMNSNKSILHTRAFSPNVTEIFYQDTEFHWLGPVAEISIQYNLNQKNGSKKNTGSEFGGKEF
jgi:outer membrane receptor protein involved in Fe transport